VVVVGVEEAGECTSGQEASACVNGSPMIVTVWLSRADKRVHCRLPSFTCTEFPSFEVYSDIGSRVSAENCGAT
jgi:hypothetical protein